MSLNGIDSSKVSDAYKGALGSDGGWFLLNYTSRDEIDLYQLGSDGSGGLRKALEDYADKSPLYGLLHLGGKKALVKYVPEGTSRLLQARTTVHFAEVADKLAPSDATIAAGSPQDLNDAAVRSAIGLPKVSQEKQDPAETVPVDKDGDRKPVKRVSDDQKSSDTVEEVVQTGTPAPRELDPKSRTIPRPSTAMKNKGTSSELEQKLDHFGLLGGAPQKQTHSRVNSNNVMGLKAFLSEVQPPINLNNSSRASKDTSPSLSRDAKSAHNDFRISESEELPTTSYSARPSTSDMWRSWKPKLKLGPRPVENDRLDTPSADRQRLPAGVKMKARKSSHEERPKSRKPESSRPSNAASTDAKSSSRPSSSRPNSRPDDKARPAPNKQTRPPVPSLPKRVDSLQKSNPDAESNHTTLDASPQAHRGAKGPTSGGVEESQEHPDTTGLGIDILQTSPPGLSAPMSIPPFTPEKQRLMRALQLRKKQHDDDPSDAEPPLDTPRSPPSADSRGVTPDLHSVMKSDSGVDVEEPMPPVRSPKGSVGGLLNPLQSHPVNSRSASPRVTPRLRAARTPSGDINKKLPQLPPEANQDEAVVDEPEPASSRPTSLKRKRSVDGDAETNNDQNDTHSSAVDPKSTEPDNKSEAAHVEDAQSPAVPPPQHDRNTSASTPTNASATIKTAPSHQDSTMAGVHSDGLPSPGLPDFSTPVPALPQRHPSNPSPPASSRPTLNSRRSNKSPDMSRRIQALSKISYGDRLQHDGQEQSAYESAQAFLAPGTLPDEHNRAPSSTAVGRAYDASRSRSPSKNSIGMPRSSRAPQSFDRSKRNSLGPESTAIENPTGYRKRDSLSITAHIMRGHQQQMQHVSDMSISEEPGDDNDGMSTLQDGLPARAETEPDPSIKPILPLADSRPSNLTFKRQTSSRSEIMNRPPSRGSTSSGRTRGSFEGWRSALSNVGIGRRDRSSNASRRRPFTSMSSRRDSTNNTKHDFSRGLDRVEEVSEGTTLASRASKMLKRMSQMNGGSAEAARKSNPVNDQSNIDPAEKELARHREEQQAMPAPGRMSHDRRMVVGDLNVQFPDTLLWKRRWVEVDGAGNLVLSAPTSTPRSKTGISASRKYHLTEFKQPVIPSWDRQEMPHSVVLDFIERGGCLQLAAEDHVQQGALVKRLVDAHRTWLYTL